ncbi:MAG: DUF2127 domain-containing protein [Candidatus Kaiserbacteria bacterium]|nr:DUF2127 domain-containing protein [Candidatus Kaiserbacteria bacterium]
MEIKTPLADKKIIERDLLWLFDGALVLKAIHGALEVLAAVLVLTVSPSFVVRVATFVTGGELAQEPNDFIATAILNAAQSFAVSPHFFIALYLVIHGVIKTMLVIGIFAGKRIAYPLFMFALLLFGAYELYRGFARQESLLYALALFDFVLLVLTAHEYRLRYPDHSSSSDRRADYADR